MKQFYTRILGVAGLSIIAAGVCKAQTGTLALKAPKGAITIDGTSTDWGDSLSYYNSDKKIRYAISNDQTNLYLAVKTSDAVQENNILAGGLTFSINTKGKKSSSFSTTFPEPAGNVAMNITKPGESTDDKKLRANVTKFKKIAVSGFKDISEDDITSTNSYGIKTAISYDADGNLVFEELIPLALFHAGDLAKGEWAFNIKLNGLEGLPPSATPTSSTAFGKNIQADNGRSTLARSSGGGRKGSDPTAQVSSSSSNNSGSTPTIDFWGKFTLAQ